MHRLLLLDRDLLVTWTLLVIFGLVVLYSAGQTDVVSTASRAWERQAVWLVVGVVAAVFTFRFSTRILEWATPLLYGAAIVLLVLTLIFGTGAGTAASTKSWLTLGGFVLANRQSSPSSP